MQICTQRLKLCGKGGATAHQRRAHCGLVGARHLRRMPAPVGAQLLGQSLVALQVRLRGLRSSMKTPSYSRKSLIERSM